MSGAAKKKPRALSEARSALAALAALSNSSSGTKRGELMDALHRGYARMTNKLFDVKDQSASKTVRLVTETLKSDFIPLSFQLLPSFSINCRKQFTYIFTGITAFQVNNASLVAGWVRQHESVIDQLISFFARPDLASCAGEILRIMVAYESLARLLWNSERFDALVRYATDPHMAVWTESFATLRELLLNAPRADIFLHEYHQRMIERLHGILDENNYGPCREGLRLLHDIMMSFPEFQPVYVCSEQNLMVIMRLMSSKYRSIALDAFHVFKMFVLAPERPPMVLAILRRNVQTLIDFMEDIFRDSDDEEAQREKDALVDILRALWRKNTV